MQENVTLLEVKHCHLVVSPHATKHVVGPVGMTYAHVSSQHIVHVHGRAWSWHVGACVFAKATGTRPPHGVVHLKSILSSRDHCPRSRNRLGCFPQSSAGVYPLPPQGLTV